MPVETPLALDTALVSEPQCVDQGPVRGEIVLLEVVEEATAGTDHLEQTPATVVILGVGAEMIGDNEGARGRLKLRFGFQHADGASAAGYVGGGEESGC